MKKFLSSKIIPALLGLFLCAQNTFSTHSAHPELFYRHVSDSTYEITLIFYQTCYGSGAPSIISIQAKSTSLNKYNSISCSRLAMSGPGVPALQPPNMFNCYNSTACLEEVVFRGTWTSPARATDWVFNFQQCCRSTSGAPANIQNGAMYVEAGLNNLDFPDGSAKNWSPLFHNRRPNHPGYKTDTVINYYMKYLNYGRPAVLRENAVEYQGDSVAYSFYNPQTNGGVAISYRNGYCFSGCNKGPLPTMNGPLKINPITGVINLVPGQPQSTGIYDIGIQATEYRKDTVYVNGVLNVVSKRIGHVRRDITINILDSTYYRVDSMFPKSMYLTEQPANNTLKVFFHNGITNSPNLLIKCNTISPDGSDFRLVDSTNYVKPYDSTVAYLPILSAKGNCTSQGYSEYVDLKLGRDLDCHKYYLIMRTGNDLDVLESECGYIVPEFTTAQITTEKVKPVDLGPDTTVCSNRGFSMNLRVKPIYESYYWSTWDTVNAITVSYPTRYWVEVENKLGCKTRDTIRIFDKYCPPPPPPPPSLDTSTGSRGPGTGIESNSKSQWKLYPNPATSFLILENPQNESIRINIRNGLGEIILMTSDQSSQVKLDVSDFSSGIYFVEIELADRREVRKFLIQ